jgi:5-methylcytosine-specific restriction endonuclease McrA
MTNYTECPVPECDISRCGEKETIESHFLHCHRDYEKKYTLMRFVGSTDFYEYVEREFSSIWDLDTSDYRSAVENHPVFTVEMYVAYFGSIQEAYEESKKNKRPVIMPDEDIDHPSWREMWRESILDLTTPKPENGENYEENRNEVIKRDNFECRVCGDGYGNISTFHIHHITPASVFLEADGPTDFEAMNDQSNLITLCPSCHGKYEGDHQGADPAEFVELVESA